MRKSASDSAPAISSRRESRDRRLLPAPSPSPPLYAIPFKETLSELGIQRCANRESKETHQ